MGIELAQVMDFLAVLGLLWGTIIGLVIIWIAALCVWNPYKPQVGKALLITGVVTAAAAWLICAVQ